MPKGIAAIGSVLPREKTPVESVPCNRFTISTRVGAACSEAARGASEPTPPATTAAPADGTPIVDPIAANPVALRKVRLLPTVMPTFNSELIFLFDGPMPCRWMKPLPMSRRDHPHKLPLPTQRPDSKSLPKKWRLRTTLTTHSTRTTPQKHHVLAPDFRKKPCSNELPLRPKNP